MENIQNSSLQTLKDLYYKSLDNNVDTLTYLNNPIKREKENKRYYDLINKMKTNYNLQDPIIIQTLVKIDMDYHMNNKNKSYRKYSKYTPYNDSLGDIMGLLDEIKLLDYKTLFIFFTLLEKYEEEPAKEMLEHIYEEYFCKHLDDLQGIFEFYSYMKSKGMPDSDFIDIFDLNLFNKMNNYVEQKQYTRKRSEEFGTEQEIKKNKF